MGRKPTMEDVARAAGVSAATVDRVLNRRGGVDPEKETRVLAAARQLRLDRALDRAPRRTLRIAVLLQAPDNPFHAALRSGVDLAGRLHADLKLQFLFHHIEPTDPAGVAALVERQDRTIDGLIVTSPDEPRIATAVRRFAQTRPVVALATDLPTSGRSVYVGPDDRRAGRVAGDLMGLHLGPAGGRVLLIAGSRTIAGQAAREAGFRAIIGERHAGVVVASVAETGESAERAADAVLRGFRADSAIRGVYHLSVGAAPVVNALRQLGRATDTVFITHELTADRRTLLRERAIAAVIDQQPGEEARLAVEAMARLLGRLDGKAASVHTDFRIYLPENA